MLKTVIFMPAGPNPGDESGRNNIKRVVENLDNLNINPDVILCPTDTADKAMQTALIATGVFREIYGEKGADRKVELFPNQKLNGRGSFGYLYELPRDLNPNANTALVVTNDQGAIDDAIGLLTNESKRLPYKPGSAIVVGVYARKVTIVPPL